MSKFHARYPMVSIRSRPVCLFDRYAKRRFASLASVDVRRSQGPQVIQSPNNDKWATGPDVCTGRGRPTSPNAAPDERAGCRTRGHYGDASLISGVAVLRGG
jgi:hypothetical protein